MFYLDSPLQDPRNLKLEVICFIYNRFMFNFYPGQQQIEGFPMIYFNAGHSSIQPSVMNDYWLQPYSRQLPSPYFPMENFWNSNLNIPQISPNCPMLQPFQANYPFEKVQQPEGEEKSDLERNEQKISDVKLQNQKQGAKGQNEEREMKNRSKHAPKKESQPKKFPQNRSRNQNSNIYRAFLKLIKSKGYRKMLSHKIQKIVKHFQIPYHQDLFTDKFLAELPPFTNYVNKSEFMRVYEGRQYESKIFKHLFDDFIRNQGYLHLLTIKYFKKVKSQSITDFLSAMRNTKEQLIDGISDGL